jgi:hypothetical protein
MPTALDKSAGRMHALGQRRRARRPYARRARYAPRDVFAYFTTRTKRAPAAAMALIERLAR